MMNKLFYVIVFVILTFPGGSFALPKKVYLPVQFLCQAPQGNWSQPWQDACEEAAILMAMGQGKGGQDILKLVDFQEKNYGGHFDLNADQISQLIKDYYHYNDVEVKSNITIEEIKSQLAQGQIIIAPMAGRLLHNPYFTPPGPIYHNVVVKGYDDRTGEFITNDPGSKRGRNYRYKYEVFYNALHDWPGHKADMLKGGKTVVVVRYS